MDYKAKWKYRRALNMALKNTNYDAQNFLILVILIGFPLGLIVSREMPALALGLVLLPLSLIYYFTFYRWHAETRRGLLAFTSSARVSVSGGMLDINDGKEHAVLPLENVRELAVFIPEKDRESTYWWIVVLKGLEYLVPKEAEGVESLLREFRDDPVFDTHPVDRPDIRTGRWSIWLKEGTG